MNRQQLRDIAKRQEKVTNKINRLPGDVISAIKEMERQAVADTTCRVMEQIDTCYIAAIITVAADKFTLTELEDIRDITDKYLIENGDFLKEFKEDWKGYLDKMNIEVTERALELIESGKKQLDVIKILRKEYPKLTTSHLNLAFKSAKEEYMKPKTVIANENEDFEREKMLELLKKEKGVKDMQTIIRTGARKEVETVGTLKEVAPVEVKTLKLKSKELILEGEYGEYQIKNGELKTGSLTFKNIQEIYKYSEDEIAKFKATIEELKQAWAEV